MSEAGRQSFTDKASSALKPDSQKTGTEKVGDSVKGTTDSLASSVQPNSEKSTTQKAGDTLSGNKTENSESVTDKVKSGLGI